MTYNCSLHGFKEIKDKETDEQEHESNIEHNLNWKTNHKLTKQPNQ